MTGSAALSSTEPAAARRYPDFFIVGHAKSGTTAMYEMLRRHPQVYLPENRRGVGKEPWFFAQDNPNPQRSRARDISYTGRTAIKLEDYLSLFQGARADQIIGEGSTSYLWSPTAPARIHAARPDARIIAIFREPASFLRSLHLELLQKGTESEHDFRKAVALDAERLRSRNIPERAYWPAALIYSDRVRYVEQLERYHTLFAREQVLVLIYEDFRADNAATMRRVMSFLGIDEMALETVSANPTVAPRSATLRSVTRGLKTGEQRVWRTLRGLGKRLTSRGVRERVLYPVLPRLLFREPAPPDEEFMLELRRRFKPEVVALGDYLQRDLVTLWGYERLN